MDDSRWILDLLVALAIAVGLAGVVVPILPGVLLVGAALVVWAAVEGGWTAWVLTLVALGVLVVGQVVKYLVPGRNLKAAGVPGSTLWLGVLLGIVGFFVIPVIGIFVGFVLGVWLAEVRRLGTNQAWPSTLHALKAAGLSILIELLSGVLATVVWVSAVVLTW